MARWDVVDRTRPASGAAAGRLAGLGRRPVVSVIELVGINRAPGPRIELLGEPSTLLPLAHGAGNLKVPRVVWRATLGDRDLVVELGCRPSAAALASGARGEHEGA
jgi:hypothetical protein